MRKDWKIKKQNLEGRPPSTCEAGVSPLQTTPLPQHALKAGWEIKKLGDICEFRRGLTYSKNDEVENSSNAVLRSNNIDLITNQLDLSEIKYISDKIKIDETKKVKRNSLLICTANGSKAHLGKVALIDDDYDFAFGGFMGLLIPSESVYPRFFYYALISENYKKFIKSLSDGANINNLKFQDLSKFEIPVPSLEKQKRIVKILDEKFTHLETIKANAQTNLQNAKDLFQSQLAKAFSNTTWEKKRLETIAKIKSGFAFKGSAFKTNGEYQVLRLGNVKQNYLRIDEKAVFVSGLSSSDLSKAQVNIGDLVVTQTGTKGKRDYGFVAIIDRKNLLLNQRLAAITTNECLFNRYLLYYSYTESFKDQFFANEGGTVGQGNIGLTDIKEIEISLPPLPEQKRIVKELDTLSEKVKALQNIYEKMLLDCEELKQSLLAKAFEGNL